MQEYYGIIYRIDLNNQPVYIGQTKKSLENRWKEHCYIANSENTTKQFAIHKAIKKYGINNFQVFEVEKCYSKEELNRQEEYWIRYYKTFISENGYNLTYGGENSAEKNKRKCYQYDLEGNFIREFESVNQAARAINQNENSHSNLIKVLNGQLNIAYGYRWSYKKVEKLDKIKNNYTGRAKRIGQYDKNGKLIRIFDSIAEVVRTLNVSRSTISNAANGLRSSAYGYYWNFIL